MPHSAVSSAKRSARALLRPEVLAGLKNLELVAKSVVDGFLIGLHRSPNFGFSQEFAEYKEYVQGDDPKFIDWNVFARTDRTYVKRFFGETNSHLMVFLDASASMGFSSGDITKFRYAQFLAASLLHLSERQNDAIGCVVFDEEIRDFVKPASRSGQLQTLLRIIGNAVPQTRTDFSHPSERFRRRVGKKGLVAVISDFYCEPEPLIQELRGFASRGQDIVLFQILDGAELAPEFDRNVLLKDLETEQSIEVDPIFLKETYPGLLGDHIEKLRLAATALGADFVQIKTSDSLHKAMHRYLVTRERK